MYLSVDSQKQASATANVSTTGNENLRGNHAPLDYTEEVSLEFPDGGWQAWSVVFGSWCALLPSFGIMNISGIQESWLADHQLQGYSKASISWIFSKWFFLFYVGSILAGMMHYTLWAIWQNLIDYRAHLRPARCQGHPNSTSMMALSVPQAYYQFILGFSILGGLSASAIIPPSVGTINHRFYKRRGLAIGVSCTSTGIGGIIFTNLFGTPRDKIGFPWAVRILGFVSLGCFSISMLFTRTSVTSIPGRVIPDILADRWGRFHIMILAGAVCTILILALWLTANESEAAIISFATLFGFWAGPAISLTPVCVAQVSRTEDYSKRYGTTTTMPSVCLLVAIPVAGEVSKAQNPSSHNEIVYSGLIVFCRLSYASSKLFLALTKGITVGWSVTRIF